MRILAHSRHNSRMMTTDRTTKLLLALVAFGLMLNAFAILTSPRSVSADSTLDRQIEILSLNVAAIDGNLSKIAKGTCVNPRLCGGGL